MSSKNLVLHNFFVYPDICMEVEFISYVMSTNYFPKEKHGECFQETTAKSFNFRHLIVLLQHLSESAKQKKDDSSGSTTWLCSAELSDNDGWIP